MIRCFLTSNGIVPEVKKDFLSFLKKDSKGLKVAFIPTAADPEPDKSFVQSSFDQMDELGFDVTIIDLKGQTPKTLKPILENMDLIWVNGGNTFYLLDHIKRSGFGKLITPLLEKNKIYIGVSAGSCVACPDIEFVKWKELCDDDIIKSKDLTALNFIQALIVPHYKPSQKSAVQEGAKTTNIPVIALSDRQAIIVEDKDWKIVGTGKKSVFNCSPDLI